jgi:hypothetical protein
MLTLLFLACFGTSEDPCGDYCAAVCDCSDAQACDDCHAVYDDADADLQDECEAELATATCDSGTF